MNSQSTVQNPFLKALFGLIAIIVVPIYQGGKWLSEKAFDGWKGWLLGIIVGLPLSIAGGIYAGHWVGWNEHPAAVAWVGTWAAHFFLPFVGVVAGVLSFLFLLTYAWTILYLLAVKPVTTLADKIRHWATDRAYERYTAFNSDFIEVVKTIFQPSSLWSTVQEKDKKHSWVSGFIGVVSYLSLAAGTLWLGWHILTGVHGLLAAYIGWLAWLPAALVVYFVLFSVVPIVGELIEHAVLTFGSVTSGCAVAVALKGYTAAGVTALGGSSTLVVVADVAVGLVVMAYVFPLVYLILSGGFMKKIAENVRKLLDGVMDEPKNDFRRLFHQTVTVALALAVAPAGAHLLLGMLAVPAPLAILAIAAAMVLVYILVGELLDNSAGNALTDLALAAGLGVRAGFAYAAHGLVLGTIGAIVAGVLVSVVTFCVVFPIVYRGIRAVCNKTGLSDLGKPLGAAHDKVWEKFEKVMRKFERVYECGYWADREGTNDSDFRKAFLHVVNLGSPVVGFIGGVLLCHFLGLGTVLTVVVSIVTALLAYLLLGQVILHGGAYVVGVVAMLVGGSWAGTLAYAAQPERLYSLAVPAGIVAAALVFFFVFPAGYIALRYLTSRAATPVLKALSSLYDGAWKLFDKLIWQPFLAVYRAVRDNVWLPIWHLIVRFFTAVWGVWLVIWNGVKEAWDGIFGRHNRS